MSLNRDMVWLLLTGLMTVVSCQQVQDIEKPGEEVSFYEDLPFDMPRVKEASFPDYAVSITAHGASGDGVTDNTGAIAAAIEQVSQKGGGKVIIPPGIWKTGPVILKDNINLHVEKGALVIFSDDFDQYPLIETSFEGLETWRCLSPIYGKDLENIALTGQGVFDGSGDSWRFVKRGKMTASQWKKLVGSGGVLSDDQRLWFPTEQSKKGYEASIDFNIPPFKTKAEFEEVKDFLRPVMVSLVGCKRVLLDGPTFQNSPAWNIHPLMSEDVIIRNLTVRNPWYSQNGDGLDLESCKNVLIYNNSFDVGDDAICFKSGKNEDGRKRGMPTENVIVKNNVVYHGHGGFVVGSEMSGGVRNVHISQCTFMGTDVGLRFKSTRGRGGVVENIYISDIRMVEIPTEAIRFNMFYSGNSPVLEEDQEADDEARNDRLVPVTEETPSFRNIFMKNITVVNSNAAALLQGLPEMNLENVTLENAMFETKKGIIMIDADKIRLKNVSIASEESRVLTIYNGQDVSVEYLDINNTDQPEVMVLGTVSRGITFSKNDFSDPENQIKQGKSVPAGAYVLKD